MSSETLRQLKEQAQRAAPEIRAAALLRIARVESAVDRDEALRTLDAGLAAMRELPAAHHPWQAGYARLVAAAIAPERVDEIPVEGRIALSLSHDMLVHTMLEHGQSQAAIGYTLKNHPGLNFPFGTMEMLLRAAESEYTQVALLRRAVDAWQRPQRRPIPPPHISLR